MIETLEISHTFILNSGGVLTTAYCLLNQDVTTPKEI